MTRWLIDINAASGWGAVVGVAVVVVVAFAALLLVALATVIPTPAIALARDAALVILWAVVLVTMAMLTTLFYTEYLLRKEGLAR